MLNFKIVAQHKESETITGKPALINDERLSEYLIGDLAKNNPTEDNISNILSQHIQSATKFVRDKLIPNERILDEKHPVKDKENMQKITISEEFNKILNEIIKLGWFGLSIPEEYGGEGLPSIFTDRTIIELAYSSAGVAVTMSVSYSVQHAIKTFGNNIQKAEYLNRFAKGEIGAICITEPNAGSDAKSMTLSAKKDGTNYILNGSKIFITSAGIAGTYLIFANTEPGIKTKDNKLSAFLVDANTKGLSIGRLEEKLGQHTSPTAEIILTDCLIPDTKMLGEYNKGWDVLYSMLTDGRIGIASLALGIANRSYKESSTYARKRKQFGLSISSFKPIHDMLALMKVRNIGSKMLIDFAAYLKDEFGHQKEHANAIVTGASLAKLFSSENAKKSALETIQIHGGNGYTKDYPGGRLLNDSLVTSIYEGSSQIQKLLISRPQNLNAFFVFLDQLDIEKELLKARTKIDDEVKRANSFNLGNAQMAEVTQQNKLLESIFKINDRFQDAQDKINRLMKHMERDEIKVIDDRLLNEIISFIVLKLVLYRTALILNLPDISNKKLEENLDWMNSLLIETPKLFLSHNINFM